MDSRWDRSPRVDLQVLGALLLAGEVIDVMNVVWCFDQVQACKDFAAVYGAGVEVDFESHGG